MRWTRSLLYNTSGWFNQEPLTTLDKTARFPAALKEIYLLISKEYGIFVHKEEVKIHNGYIYFRPLVDYIFQILTQHHFYLKLSGLLLKLGKAREDFDHLTEEFLGELGGIREVDLKTLSNEELYDHLFDIICFDARWIFKLGEGPHTLLHYFSESALKTLYGLLVEDPNPSSYSDLLVGFPNKLLEADKALWQVVEGELSKKDFLSKYGYRATDATLIKPTVGEDDIEFQHKIEMFKKMRPPNFDQILESATRRRKEREEFVGRNFRCWVPFGKNLFNKVLTLARKYITVREDRRFYYTMGTYPIRRTCLELGSRFDFLRNPSDIFFMTKDELETAVHNSKIIDKEEIRKRIASRKSEWQSWRKQTLPISIEGQ